MREKKRKHLTFTQRLQIESLYNAKLSKQQIATAVGVHISTIYRELKRGEYEHTKSYLDYGMQRQYRKSVGYSPNLAQDKHDVNMSGKGPQLKIGKNFEFVRYVERRVLKDKISPCAVIGEVKRNNLFENAVSKTTLYRYIEMGIFENLTMQYVASKKKVNRKAVAKRPPKGTSIEKRPQEIAQRNTFGHWEMDCVCGPTKPTLLILSERLTRNEIIFKMPNQTADSVIHCLNVLEKRYGKLFRKVFKSITMDNGSEFSDVKGIERSIYKGKRVTTYYCHPYCSSERGTNERLNREVRRRVPKGYDISLLSDDEVQAVQTWVNNYPREVLGYATSGELFDRHVAQLSV